MSIIDNEKYNNLSFLEKADMLIAFNDVLNKVFDHSLTLYVNKKPSDNYETRCVDANMEEAKLVINGVLGNPYLYLRDIMFMHLSYNDIENYDYIQIGRVRYDENFTYEFPQIAFYNEWNIRFLRGANKFISHFLTNTDNEYKKDFLRDFDYLITNDGIKDIQKGYDAFDNCLKRGVYQEMDVILDTITKMMKKDKLTPKELALLSLDDVVVTYMHEDSELLDDVVINKHYRQFLDYYFKDYSKYIDIEIDEFGIVINGREIIEDEILMDVLMQEIEVIENNHHLIDNIVSDEQLARFNKALNKNYSKLDCYFYSRLDMFDEHLKNQNYEIINYNKWTNIYRDDVKKSIFVDNRDPLKDLLDNNEFIDLVEGYLLDKKENHKPLIKIHKMMNESYGKDFKLTINQQAQCDSGMGLTDDNQHIYLNADAVRDKLSLLITLFHEYRHLIQKEESLVNTGIYNDKLYEYIKKENETSPCGNSYTYAELTRFGYMNDVFYQVQPTEYDAELFAERFLKEIEKRMKTKMNINYSMFVADNYRNCKFIDSEKFSIESYENYLIVNEIPQSIQEELECYNVIKEKIDNIKTKEDAIEIISDPFFTNLKIEDKIKVYKHVSSVSVNMTYNKEKKNIIIGKDKLDSLKVHDYQILETIIGLEVDKKIANNEIKFSDRSEYIYKEMIKFKPKDISEFNCFAPHSYHSCSDKYYRIISMKNKTNKGRKSK